MKENNLHSIFEQTDCLSRQDMLSYLDRKLSTKKQFLFEKHLLSCAMCRDEFEGMLEMQNYNKLPFIIGELNSKIDNSINTPLKKISFKINTSLRIAAVILALIGSAYFLNYYLQYSSKEYYDQEMVSQSIEESVEEERIIAKDTFSKPLIEATNTPVKSSLKDNNKSSLAVSEELSFSGTKTHKDIVIADASADKLDDLESDVGFIAAEDELKEEQAIVAKSMGEGVSDVKQIRSEELVAEELELEIEEVIVYDEESKGNERRLNDNVSRAKMLSVKKTKSSEKSISYQQEGINAYYDGNYQEATVALKNSIKYETKEDKTQLYLSQAYAAQGDSKNALIQLNKLLKNKDSQYQNEAMWEKAQLLIRMEKRKSAINVLNNLLKVNSPYKIEAQQKLDSLLTN